MSVNSGESWVTDKELRRPHEQYLQSLGVDPLQVKCVKRLFGLPDGAKDFELDNHLVIAQRELGGMENNLDHAMLKRLLLKQPNPAFSTQSLNGTWQQIRDAHLNPCLAYIAEQDDEDLIALIDQLVPLDRPAKSYIPVTLLLPSESQDYHSETKALTGYQASWQLYQLGCDSWEKQVNQDKTWALKLFLAFSFLGLADTTIYKNGDGSTLFHHLLTTANLLDTFSFYDLESYKETLLNPDSKAVLEFEVIENIFRHTESAYCAIPPDIADLLVNAKTLLTQPVLPTLKLAKECFTPFERCKLYKPKIKNNKEDKSHYTNDARNIRIALNYLLCMTSGTAITFHIPIKEVKLSLLASQQKAPVILMPQQWQRLTTALRESKRGLKKLDKRSRYQNLYTEMGDDFNYDSLMAMPENKRHKWIAKALAASININDDADVDCYRVMPHVDVDLEW
mgnify:CR=1 FL=1